KQMEELGDKVPEADKTKIEGLLKDLRYAIASEDDDRIQSLTTELQQALYNVSSNLYQQAGDAPGGPEAPGGEGFGNGAEPTDSGADDVIDADFTESK
ncbi:MAG: molecular chaperone DnaK, partial [Okeania sp. SIO2H7]|nr:molecular chaperone DnaK [Okeania sp. SIO2H7]